MFDMANYRGQDANMNKEYDSERNNSLLMSSHVTRRFHNGGEQTMSD